MAATSRATISPATSKRAASTPSTAPAPAMHSPPASSTARSQAGRPNAPPGSPVPQAHWRRGPSAPTRASAISNRRSSWQGSTEHGAAVLCADRLEGHLLAVRLDPDHADQTSRANEPARRVFDLVGPQPVRDRARPAGQGEREPSLDSREHAPGQLLFLERRGRSRSHRPIFPVARLAKRRRKARRNGGLPPPPRPGPPPPAGPPIFIF